MTEMGRLLTVEPFDGDPIRLHVRALDRAEWRALVAEHPPREEDRGAWNEDTFPPALIAACTGIPEAEAHTWWDEWPSDATDQLYLTCLQVSSPSSLAWANAALDRDSRLALEVAYCAEKGLAPSEFTARSSRDQDLVLAAWVRAKDVCPGCHVPSAAMTDLEAGDWSPRSCVHCESRKAADDSVPKEHQHRIHHLWVPRAGGED